MWCEAAYIGKVRFDRNNQFFYANALEKFVVERDSFRQRVEERRSVIRTMDAMGVEVGDKDAAVVRLQQQQRKSLRLWPQ